MRIWEKYRTLAMAQKELSSVDLELTRWCNLSCVHCYKLRTPEPMSETVFNRALQAIEKSGAMLVGFNGGEPLSHPLFLTFAKRVLESGRLLTVVTNGTLLTQELLEALSPYRGIRFQISLYGTDRHSFHALTQGPPHLWDSLMELLPTIPRLGLHLETVLLVLKETAAGLPRLYAQLDSWGVNPFLNPVLFPREDGDPAPLAHQVTQKEFDTISHLLESAAYPQCEGTCRACGAGASSLAISHRGELFPCLLLPRHLGNIGVDSLKDAIQSSESVEFTSANCVPARCMSCDWYADCVRCPGGASFGTQDVQTIPPNVCEIAKMRTLSRRHARSSPEGQ